MLETKSQNSQKNDSVSYRIQELTEQRRELSKEVDSLTTGRDPDAYVTALIDLQRCERSLGILLSRREGAQDMKLSKLKGNDEDVSGGGMSITIFFLPGVDFYKVHSKVTKVISWKWLRGCIYAYEQKGTDELTLGHNAHVHIFAPKQHEKQRAINQLVSAFKGLIYSPSSVHVLLKPATWLGTCQAYLTGEKSGVLESSYEFDRLWRGRHNLPDPEITAADFILPVD